VAIGNRQSADFRRFMDRIATSPDYDVNGSDIAIGRIMANVNNIGRLIFYRLVANRAAQ
jgi:hypothetical protein